MPAAQWNKSYSRAEHRCSSLLSCVAVALWASAPPCSAGSLWARWKAQTLLALSTACCFLAVTHSGVLWSCWLQAAAGAAGLREERQCFEVGTTFYIVFVARCHHAALFAVQWDPECATSRGPGLLCEGGGGGALPRAGKPWQCWVLLSTLVAATVPVSGFPLSCGVPLRSCNYTAVITTLICLSFMPCFVWLNKPFLGHYLIWYGPPQ